jgi:hypothetical protein
VTTHHRQGAIGLSSQVREIDGSNSHWLGALRYALLVAMALVAAGPDCARQSPAAESEEAKKMNYTLDICGDRKIHNPEETDIRQAVLALDTKKGEAFLILGLTDMTYIQASGDQRVGFDLEYQEADIRHHYRAKGDFTADQIVKAFVAYSAGTEDWKKTVEWAPIKW